MAKQNQAKKTVKAKKAAAPKKAAAEKPKRMAARRPAPAVTATPAGRVFRSIVSTILNSQKKTFTSTEIADLSNASPRHSRRTLSQLTRASVLTVNRVAAPYKYSVRSRTSLRQLGR